MELKQELQELVDILLKDGVRVFVQEWSHNTGPKTYCYFTKDNNIGYAQVEYFGGISFSTVHIPNKNSGTGFKTDVTDPHKYEAAFHSPVWALSRDLSPAFKSWEDFVSKQHYKDFIEVTIDKE